MISSVASQLPSLHLLMNAFHALQLCHPKLQLLSLRQSCLCLASLECLLLRPACPLPCPRLPRPQPQPW